jgi:MoaA/NifB/PqqE/SkfB family radical SAM enzyme
MVGMPISYFIDPINVCNLRCPLCPTGRREQARRAGRMALEDLQRVIDEVAPFAYRLELYNWGEPLFHPNIFDMIEYASQRRISVGLSSNLNHMDAGMARRLVESGLSQLVVSIDGATQETYSAYRRQGDLSKVLKNLQLLLEFKRTLNSSSPFIIWRMLVGKHNEHEVEMVRDMAYSTEVDSFSIGALYVNTNDPEQVDQWLPTDTTYSPYNQSSGKLENTWSCHELWESMVINWDGGVAPCCWLHDPQHDFASVATQSVREIWNSPSYVSARRVIGRRRKSPDDVPTICHRCRGHPDYLEY